MLSTFLTRTNPRRNLAASTQATHQTKGHRQGGRHPRMEMPELLGTSSRLNDNGINHHKTQDQDLNKKRASLPTLILALEVFLSQPLIVQGEDILSSHMSNLCMASQTDIKLKQELLLGLIYTGTYMDYILLYFLCALSHQRKKGLIHVH